MSDARGETAPAVTTAAGRIVWTEERIAECRRLRDENGLSAGQIAARMGLSRNSVVGAWHRYLPQNPDVGARSNARKYVRAEVPKVARIKVARVTPPSPCGAQGGAIRVTGRAGPRPAPLPQSLPAREREEAPLSGGEPVTPARTGGALDPAGFPYAVHFNARTSRQFVRPLWGMAASTGLVCGADTGDRAVSYCAACRKVLFTAHLVKRALDPKALDPDLRRRQVQAARGMFTGGWST